MTIDDAFEHMARTDEFEEKVADHRQSARDIIRATVKDELEYEADVDVELFDSATAIVKISPTAHETLGRDIDEKGELITSITPSVIRISTADAELDLQLSNSTRMDKSQRDRIRQLKELITALCEHYEDEPGAPMEAIKHHSPLIAMDPDKAEQEIESLRRKGEVYEPQTGFVRTT